MYKCKSCSSTFASKNGLQKHNDAKHNLIKYSCKLCEKVFMQKNNLENHIRLHTGERPFVCDKCNKSYVAKKNLERHKLTHLGESGKKFKCTICKMRFTELGILKRHMRKHTGDKRYHCKNCEKCFVSPGELRIHYLRHHSDEKPFGCAKCKKTFTSSSCLNYHLESHETQLKFKCYLCAGLYCGPIHLKRHIASVHSSKRSKTSCVFCEKEFSSNHLWRHIRQHIQEKNCIYNICGKGFVTNGELLDHVNRHHLHRTKSTACPNCHLKFFTKQAVDLHFKRNHVSKSSYRFECFKCAKRFFTQGDLNRHLNSTAHTSITCIFCNDGQVHYLNSEIYLRHISKHTGEKLYICCFCPAEFIFKQDYEEHFRIHTGEKPYQCQECGEKFETKWYRKRHEQENHNV